MRRNARQQSVHDHQHFEFDFNTVIEGAYFPLRDINGIDLPHNLANLGFCLIEATENYYESIPMLSIIHQVLSGKVHPLRVHDSVSNEMRTFFDYRIIGFSRQGMDAEARYKGKQEFLFNPGDARLLSWYAEGESIKLEMVGGFPSDPTKAHFFSQIATLLFSDLQQRCSSTDEIWEVISSYSLQDLHQFISGGESIHYLEGENSEANILTILIDEIRFYKYLADDNRLKFHEWESDVNSPWVYLTVFEQDEERFKPFYSLGLEFY